MTAAAPGIDPSAAPSSDGCALCTAGDGAGWWFHLRRCAQCGAVGCCDSSPSQHASAHFAETGHPVVRSFEPGEDWFWDYRARAYVDGPALAPPQSRRPTSPRQGLAVRCPRTGRRSCTADGMPAHHSSLVDVSST